jgi:CBS domain-containing membrane protein
MDPQEKKRRGHSGWQEVLRAFVPLGGEMNAAEGTVLDEGKTMNDPRVRDLMTVGVVSAQPQDRVATIYDLMDERHIRHLTVVDEDGDLVGLVSHRDLLRNALIARPDLARAEHRELLRQVRVAEVMTSEVETIEPERSVEEAARIMADNRFGCLPVMADGQLVGILTEADFVRWFADHGCRGRGPAGDR